MTICSSRSTNPCDPLASLRFARINCRGPWPSFAQAGLRAGRLAQLPGRRRIQHCVCPPIQLPTDRAAHGLCRLISHFTASSYSPLGPSSTICPACRADRWNRTQPIEYTSKARWVFYCDRAIQPHFPARSRMYGSLLSHYLFLALGGIHAWKIDRRRTRRCSAISAPEDTGGNGLTALPPIRQLGGWPTMLRGCRSQASGPANGSYSTLTRTGLV